jgi:hypothetical protein
MNKNPQALIAVTTETPLLQKTQLTTQSIDMLMFQGQVKVMLEGIAKMVGMPAISVELVLPQKNKHNMRPFLDSLNSIINHVLDDQVTFTEFVPLLGEQIKVIQRIAEEEK